MVTTALMVIPLAESVPTLLYSYSAPTSRPVPLISEGVPLKVRSKAVAEAALNRRSSKGVAIKDAILSCLVIFVG